MKKDKTSILLLIIGVIALALFVVFSVCQYVKNELVFEILKDLSITISLSLTISFSFRIIKINVTQSFNNNKIVINSGISNHDEQLASKLEKAFDNLKRVIKAEEQYNQTNFYSQLYDYIPPILQNFESSKFVFESIRLQEIFDQIKKTMNDFIQLYRDYGLRNIFGDMAKTYIRYREQLSNLINDFYFALANRGEQNEN